MDTRVIINADDYGLSSTVNQAIHKCIDLDIVNRTTILVTAPYFNEAVKLAKENGFWNLVGLHINLDEGVPLTENIKNIPFFCDLNGNFNGKFNESGLNRIFFKDSLICKYCREELNAQMNLFIDADPLLMHIDSHHYVHFKLSVLKILIPLAKDYGFKSMRISRISNIDSFAKKHYKKYINNLISKNFDTTTYFAESIGNLHHFQLSNNESIEVMTHPDYVGNRLVNVISRKDNYMDIDILSDMIKDFKCTICK